MPRAASLRHRLSRRAGRHPAGYGDGNRRARLGRARPRRSRAVRRLDGGPPVTSPIRLDLVADGAVRLALEHSLYPVAERWIPQRLGEACDAPARATISVRAASVALRHPTDAPTLTLGRVAAWVKQDQERAAVVLRGAAPSSGGVLSFDPGRARLQVDPAQAADAAADLYSMLTVSAALLLASQGRALVHAAAVVAPDGGGWLLAGDARSGKSTTCATLASAGWGYLSDDQVVLTGCGDEVEVEGWLRPFHLDREASGERREVAPAELGLGGGWRRTARLAGAIFPVVSPAEPTLLAPIAAADALARLVRQTPWLLACRRTAPGVLALLTRAVRDGAFSLRLGSDTYRDAAILTPLMPCPFGRRQTQSVRRSPSPEGRGGQGVRTGRRVDQRGEDQRASC